MPTATVTTSAPPVTWRDWAWWRARAEDLATLWRRSLRFRTVVITLVLTALTIIIACVWMALAIQNDLFESRKTQALTDARRAVDSAQSTLDNAVVQDDPVQVQNLLTSIQGPLSQQSATDMTLAVRIDATPSQLAPPGFRSGGLEENMISPELRKHVRDQGGDEKQWAQSIALPAGDGSARPGIVVGQQIVVPDIGPYELYLAYDLDDAATTLSFVQATLWIVGSALVVLIGAIAWFTLRAVTTPIREAADTSAQLAAGDLGVRLTVRGEDELATLGRSFNAMADSIESQINQLAELSLVQQRFVSDVSHELRTPLTTIRLATDMLNDRRDEFDPTTARAAELLHAQVQRFELLLTDLLEISRYDAGSVQLELEPTSLARLADDVIASMQQLAEQHGSDVRLVAPGGYSPVEMDPRRIRRIVRNLLGNAIEHGEGKPIVVTVDSNQQAVALGVRDFGMGMTEADAERVFDRFWRADPSRKRTIGGTGLGLSIALGDATLHRGTLTVWSRPGHGSNFVLTLPRGPVPVEPGSPIPTDPGDDASSLDDLGLTQPIALHDISNGGRE
ncbi:HAMP domain-containing histidine kinase [Microbacterium protaetiae]|uniref:Sensor histidine kinase MtrB n=1 Tax=Microbacterium protaetiae TaxID=2509458 RepID=A0A4P6EKI4_9MICO|nr:MtrAB system histidine kinase MtrB [Microbacterium protaetiae]QAY60657.1 HAMP domain-containing histidine kinase [Microbacterium protaetiae]